MSASLLIELLTEELPPKVLAPLGDALAGALIGQLRQDGFAPANGDFTAFATPRRLAVLAREVSEQAPDTEVLVKGPSVKSALGPDGTPTVALVKFAEKRGVGVERLERYHDGRQEVFVHRDFAKGGHLDATLATKVEAALTKLPVPKMMRWGATDYEFVRPVRGLVMLHGERVVPGTVLGQTSGRTTRGHRFMGKGAIEIAHADDYESVLEREGYVVASFERRRARILESLAETARAYIAADDALYEEVTALVEFPVVYEGHFDEAFLEVPQECLMLTMRQNQKYFPILGSDRKTLTNRFLVVSNMQVADARHIIRGNERVLRARLADAKFFYDQDRKVRLEARVPGLANVVFHAKLGSQLDRVERIERLAVQIAGILSVDEPLVRRAARLCKADLLTGMVGEFPELQGTMGMHYARHDGEPETVALAIMAHYRPRFAGDSIPERGVEGCVALADKLDTLAGIWGIGLAPTGDKDPFALRRAALGVVRILVERSLPLNLDDLLLAANAGYGRSAAPEELRTFILDRLRSYLRERDWTQAEIEAVVSRDSARIDRVVPRLEAVREFSKLPEAEALAAAGKRIHNIITKSPPPAGDVFSKELLTEAAEWDLYTTYDRVNDEVRAKFEEERFADALSALATLKEPVDTFFDQVLVNVDDARLRTNRLLLLMELDGAMNRVADISKLAG